MPTEGALATAVKEIISAYNSEVQTFTVGTLVPAPDGPHEGPDMYGVCCDRIERGKNATCDCNGPVSWVS